MITFCNLAALVVGFYNVAELAYYLKKEVVVRFLGGVVLHAESKQPQQAQSRWQTIKQAFQIWHERLLPKQLMSAAAEMAFHFTLSFFPLLLVVVSTTFSIFNNAPPELETWSRKLGALSASLLPKELMVLFQQAMTNAPEGGFQLDNLLALLLGAWAATNGMAVGIKAIGISDEGLNELSMLRFWLSRLVSLLVLAAIGLLLTLVSIVMVSLRILLSLPVLNELNRFSQSLPSLGPLQGLVSNGLLWFSLLTIFSLLASLLYLVAYRLHKEKVTYRACLVGGTFFALAWALASQGFTWYIDSFHGASYVIGALGSVALLMLWLYISGAAWLLGARICLLISRYFASQHKQNHPEPFLARASKLFADTEHR